MLDELPELNDLFTANQTGSVKNSGNTKESDIQLFLSKESDKWILAEFMDVAVAGIGIHVKLPIKIDLTAAEMNNIRLKFVKNVNGQELVIKNIQVLVRWQDHDEFTGNVKLGLHFHGDVKNDPVLVELIHQLNNNNH